MIRRILLTQLLYNNDLSLFPTPRLARGGEERKIRSELKRRVRFVKQVNAGAEKSSFWNGYLQLYC